EDRYATMAEFAKALEGFLSMAADCPSPADLGSQPADGASQHEVPTIGPDETPAADTATVPQPILPVALVRVVQPEAEVPVEPVMEPEETVSEEHPPEPVSRFPWVVAGTSAALVASLFLVGYLYLRDARPRGNGGTSGPDAPVPGQPQTGSIR